MTAIEISRFGGPDVLKTSERPKPVAGEREIVIRVAAAGVARADLMQREGRYPPPPGASDIPGLDVSGVVDSLGPGVTGIKPGDRICAILAGGGYAEYCVSPVPQILPTPDNWSDIEAATLPENLFTVFDNLITRAGLLANETVLIHGGASGIGSMAIMLAKAWGARVFTTAGSRAKCEACASLGADAAINYRQADFVAEVKNLTGGRGVDVVLDIVGGPYLPRNVEALAVEGRMTVVSMQGGTEGRLDLGALLFKRLRICGSTMRARSPEQKGLVAAALQKDVWPLLPGKKFLRPVIDSTFPLREARHAHERLESGGHVGKIVLAVNE